jgi:pre-mRNA-splicing factor CWC26
MFSGAIIAIYRKRRYRVLGAMEDEKKKKKKLDYLSKYLDDREGAKKKKKAKQKHDFQQEKIRDDDVDAFLENEGNDVEDDEISEGPMIVENADLTDHNDLRKEKYEQQGHWRTEPQENSHTTTVVPQQRTRRRHDSDDEAIPEKQSQTTNQTSRHRPRHDSFSEDEVVPRRHELPSSLYQKERLPRRRRHDSSSSSSTSSSSSSVVASKPTRQRLDSSSDESGSNDNHSSKNGKKAYSYVGRAERRRHDSFSDDSHSSRSSKSSSPSRERMSSGHRSGLQNAKDFSKRESKIQSQRQKEASEMVDKHGIGETVYRKKGPNRTDTESEKRTKIKLTTQEQKQLNMGRIQRELEQQRRDEYIKIQESSFARFADDADLEQHRKNEIRPDDPMAKYALARQSNTQQQQPKGVRSRPVYKGPPPKPNRFNILPGHRWDARDRSNGFEDRLLMKRASAQHEQEVAYRYSSADL